jgi:phosphoribosyl-ATP pyrophosphohydrolase/phosphoribosyl-AMP cyclohydrolase
VVPDGPACHTNHRTCFFRSLTEWENAEDEGCLSVLHILYNEIRERKQDPRPRSYTNYLLREGKNKIDKKIGEEASEVIIADQHGDREEITAESCDLLYHLFVLWENAGVNLYQIMAEMENRDRIKDNKKEIGHQDKTF